MTTDAMPSKVRSLAAERMRRHRRRRREGLRHFAVDLREREIDALIRKGLLPRESRTDRTAVVNALYAFLDRTLREPL
jgi:hypothetical protein